VRNANAAFAAAAGRLAAAALHPGGLLLLPTLAAALCDSRGANFGQKTRARFQGPRTAQEAECGSKKTFQGCEVSR
jgi:hypothetical protein